MYTVDRTELVDALTKVSDIIAIGDTQSNNSILLEFGKESITLSAQSSAGTYQRLIACKPEGKVEVKSAIISASSLLSYAKGQGTMTLIPTEANLKLKSNGFKADLFYIGSDYEVDVDRAKDGAINIDKLTTFVIDALSRTGDMKDRVEQKSTTLGNLVTNDSGHFFSVGDSHHVVLVFNNRKSKRQNNINMMTHNMRRVFGVGGTMAVLQNRIVAFTDVEYLSLAATVDSEAISVDNVLALRDNLRGGLTTFDTSEFISALSPLTVGTELATPVTLSLDGKKLSMSVKTGASNATMTLTASDLPKKPMKVRKSVCISHLMDCVKTMKNKDVGLRITDSMVCLEQKYNLGDIEGIVFAAASVVAED